MPLYVGSRAPLLRLACGNQVHNTARSVSIAGIIKRDVEFGRTIEKVKHRPNGKAYAAIAFEAEVNQRSFDSGVDRRATRLGKIGHPEIAHKQIVKLHA